MSIDQSIEEPVHILGISAFYHDSAACLVKNGQIIAAAQEERFTRRRHDPGFPRNAVNYCLNEAGIQPSDLSCVAFYDKPWIKFERLLETYLAFAPAGIQSFLKSMPLWIKQKLWIGELIGREVGFEGELIYPEHHQSHAASAFYPSPFERAAILTMDGVGEWATASWGVGRGHQIDLRSELRFPHSLGLLYSAFTYYTGFKVNSGEYKVMGLAPYGEPKYIRLIYDEILDLREDGSFQLNMEYFNYCQGLTMTSEKFHRAFGGPPRKPETPVTQREMDLARSLQDVTEDIMLRMARHVRKETGERFLCLAGGVALNCVGNGRILKEGIFDRLWVQPAAGDAGGALGAALFAWHQVQGRERRVDSDRDRQAGSYLGPAFCTSSIQDWLDKLLRGAGAGRGVDREGKSRRMVFGPDGIWPTGSWRAEHPGRRPQPADAVGSQPQDQIPRVLSPFRPFLPGGRRLRILRDGCRITLHAPGGGRSRGPQAQHDSRTGTAIRH